MLWRFYTTSDSDAMIIDEYSKKLTVNSDGSESMFYLIHQLCGYELWLFENGSF